jgi:type I restriction enzyme S subunit
MAAEQLITEHIDLWTSAIKNRNTQGRGSSKKSELYGIKKLRELILELAVRGKLVPQESNDEPASHLLKRVADTKTQLIKEKKIRETTKLHEITDNDVSFALPSQWQWVKLGDLVEMYNGRAFKSSEWATTGLPIVRIQNLNNEQAEFNYFNGDLTDHNKIDNGSFLISWSGTPGTSFGAFIWTSGKAALNQHINKCVFHTDEINLEFMKLAVSGCMNHFIEMAQGAVGLKHVTKGTLNNAILGFPPLAEQTRIVAKVDELMTLCDQLEQQTEASLDAHQLLVDTLLATLTNAKDATELSENWARLSEHFNTLIATDYSVEKLKQTILKLAVMGKLVPQDPTDEPACELLKRIAAEKAQLIKDKKIKKQQPLPAITDEEKLFGLPEGWECCRLDDICYGITSGSTPPKSEFNEDEGVPYLKVYNIRGQSIDFEYKPQYVRPEYHSTKLKRSVLYPGDVVMNIVGPPLGKVAIIPETHPEWNCNQAITFFRPIYSKLNTYIFTYLKAGTFLNSIELIGTAGQDNISVTKSRSIVLPTPPLDEQYRIVAKVDELMSLIDRLKIRLRRAQTTQLHLADAVVYEVIGEPVKKMESAEVNTQVMRITTILSLNHEEFGGDAVIAPILLESGGSADAKDVWSKTKMSLPEFYAQLKIEIDAKYIIKPASADFGEV